MNPNIITAVASGIIALGTIVNIILIVVTKKSSNQYNKEIKRLFLGMILSNTMTNVSLDSMDRTYKVNMEKLAPVFFKDKLF